MVIETQVGVNYIKLLSQFLLLGLTSDVLSNFKPLETTTMTKLLANPKLFAAAGLLFAVASFYNLSSNSTAYAGSGLAVAPPTQTAPIVTGQIGYPNPFEKPCCSAK